MRYKLSKLYNTLNLIEVKGENVKLMSVCLSFLEEMIDEQNLKETLDNESTKKESEVDDNVK